MQRGFSVVAAVNSEQHMQRDLLASPTAIGKIYAVRDAQTAGSAYNSGLDQCADSVVVLAHQDVYFPRGWEQRLIQAITQLERSAVPWAVIGVWGVQPDGQHVGRCWCSGGNQEHVGAIREPVEVASIDEIVIVLNQAAGLRFDENLPGFHLYATDIVLQAKQRGYKAFVIDAPVVHNSRPNPQVYDSHFFAAYRYMQKKWKDQLPVRTCTVPVTCWGWPLRKAWLKNEVNRLRGWKSGGARADDPSKLARILGYESEAAAAMAGEHRQ